MLNEDSHCCEEYNKERAHVEGCKRLLSEQVDIDHEKGEHAGDEDEEGCHDDRNDGNEDSWPCIGTEMGVGAVV